MLRLFFALQPALAQAADLVARAAPLVEELHAQPVPAENLHATLCFVGALEPEKLTALQAVAATVRGRVVRLQFAALEYWDKPRILCATAGESRDAAHELAEAITAAILDVGFTPDRKPFRAHFTLARKIRAADAAQLEWPRALSPPLDVRCDQFVLMQSRREAASSIYSVVDSWPLDADESR